MVAVRLVRGMAMVLGIAAIAACGGPDVDEKPLPEPSVAASSEAAPDADPSATPSPNLDMDALIDRQDPERLLRYYVEAIRIGAWDEAAKAWSSDAQITPERLKDAYGGHSETNLVIGKGDIESAAGTLFYEAPIVVDFADTTEGERRGTIVLRRANDVPGASEEQLDWRIERSSVLEPQE